LAGYGATFGFPSIRNITRVLVQVTRSLLAQRRDVSDILLAHFIQYCEDVGEISFQSTRQFSSFFSAKCRGSTSKSMNVVAYLRQCIILFTKIGRE
jgi:hypothetical protein